MSRVDLLATGLVYRNPKPHVLSRHAYFPSLARLPDGTLLAGIDIGQAFESVDMRSHVARSTDAGQTWSEPVKIAEPDETSGAISTSCRITHVGDGRAVGLMCLFHRPDVNAGLANPETGGFVRTQFALVESRDAGKTWSKPALMKLPTDWSQFETCSPVIPLPNGRWMVPTAPWPDWSGHSPLGQKAMAFISDDAGATWNASVDVMARPAEKLAFYEHKITRLSDGRLLAVCWVVDGATSKNRANHMALSTDNGSTFGPPIAMPLLGETCTPIGLADNHVLCVYRRADVCGLWAHLGKVDGNRWVPIADQPLWGTDVASKDTGEKPLVAQMSTLRFGYPSIVKLEANDYLAVFWCVEDAASNIRWFRLRVS